MGEFEYLFLLARTWRDSVLHAYERVLVRIDLSSIEFSRANNGFLVSFKERELFQCR